MIILGELTLRAIFWYDLPMRETLGYEILKITSAVILGGMALGIALRQYHTAKRKLNLDLFDKRYKMYDSLMQLLHAFMRSNLAEQHQAFIDYLDNYRSITRGKEFVFPADIVMFMKECENLARKLKMDRVARLFNQSTEYPTSTDVESKVDDSNSEPKNLTTQFDLHMAALIRNADSASKSLDLRRSCKDLRRES